MCKNCRKTRRRSSRVSGVTKAVPLTYGDLGAAGVGAIAGFAINAALNKLIEKQPGIAQYLSPAKVVGSALGAMKTKNRMVQMALIGFGGVGAIETIQQQVPQLDIQELNVGPAVAGPLAPTGNLFRAIGAGKKKIAGNFDLADSQVSIAGGSKITEIY